MLYAFGFERVGVVVGDLYPVDPNPRDGQDGAGFPAGTAGLDDAENMRRAVPEIVDATRRLLGKVRSGQLGNPPRSEAPAAGSAGDGSPALVRAGWL